MTDLITQLADLTPGSPEDRAFAGRAEARRNAEEAYRLLLHPDDPGPVSVAERRALAAFVAALHGEGPTAAHYRALLEDSDPSLAPLVAQAVQAGQGRGPWGSYPSGPLSAEDQPGTALRLPDALRDALGARLAAAIEHAHLLVLHPRDASPRALQALLDAGWSTAAVVTLSQLVAFLSFQVRVVAGLSALQAARARIPA